MKTHCFIIYSWNINLVFNYITFFIFNIPIFNLILHLLTFKMTNKKDIGLKDNLTF